MMGEDDDEMPPTDVVELQETQLVLVEALHHIAETTDEADIARLALGALTRTEAGMAYLRANPL